MCVLSGYQWDPTTIQWRQNWPFRWSNILNTSCLLQVVLSSSRVWEGFSPLYHPIPLLLLVEIVLSCGSFHEDISNTDWWLLAVFLLCMWTEERERNESVRNIDDTWQRKRRTIDVELAFRLHVTKQYYTSWHILAVWTKKEKQKHMMTACHDV